MPAWPPRMVIRRSSGLRTLESALYRAGLGPVAGVDEVGRGACAGPLVVAACVLGPIAARGRVLPFLLLLQFGLLFWFLFAPSRIAMALPSEAVQWRFNIVPQGISAELVAQRFELERTELDQYSLDSHNRAAAAQDAGKFDAEIVGLTVTTEDQGEFFFDKDEGIRRGSSIDKLVNM